ncbi:MAG: DsbA family oxidoreductase [Muribaculaceae bacterium]|nr:DsbA family oxidoreductase [Muribaculaceae bacterium]
MKIQIWSDFQCPFCYMGEKKLENVISKMELTTPIEIEFRAYQINPKAPEIPAETMLDHFMDGHDITPEQAERRMAGITKMAAKAGLHYNLSGVKVCTSLPAHRLMKWAARKLSPGKLRKLNFAIFKANFEDNLLISDLNILADLATSVGIDRGETIDFLTTNKFTDSVMHDQEVIDTREDFEFVPFMLAPDGSVIQGVISENQILEWLKNAMDDSSEATMAKGDGCGPEGCGI